MKDISWKWVLSIPILWCCTMLVVLSTIQQQPWLGLTFVESSNTEGIIVDQQFTNFSTPVTGEELVELISEQNTSLKISRKSIIQEPDNYPSYKEYDSVFAHNKQLFTLLQSKKVTLRFSSGVQIDIEPYKRTISSLPYHFWLPNISALIVLSIGIFVWISKQSYTTALLLLSAAGYTVGTMPLSLTAYRGLTLDPSIFLPLVSLNHLGIMIFNFALAGIILRYPVKLLPTQIISTYVGISILFWLNELFRWIEPPVHSFLVPIILFSLITSSIAVAWQWRLSTDRPANRAIVKWYVLSIWCAFIVALAIYVIPTLAGKSPIGGVWLTSLLPAIIFIGFVLGVARYKLFDINLIWLKSWIWFFTGALIVLIDIGLVSIIKLDQYVSLNIAIILIAWFYVPIRQFFFQLLSNPKDCRIEQFLPEMVTAVFDSSPNKKDIDIWEPILKVMFNPVKVERSNFDAKTPSIEKHGEKLIIPMHKESQAISVINRSQGKLLFSTRDVELVEATQSILHQIEDTRRAYDQGKHNERLRVMRDLHDDLGSKLLTMIYKAPDKAQADLAREALSLLRETVYYEVHNNSTTLNAVSKKWQGEIRQRIQSAGIKLEWRTTLPENALINSLPSLNISRIFNEITSNFLKHTNTTLITVDILFEKACLVINISQNCHSKLIDTWQHGAGLNSLYNRLLKMNGEISWSETMNCDSRLSTLNTHLRIPVTSLQHE